MTGTITSIVPDLIIILMVAVCRWLGHLDIAGVKKQLQNLMDGLEAANVKGQLEAAGFRSQQEMEEKSALPRSDEYLKGWADGKAEAKKDHIQHG